MLVRYVMSPPEPGDEVTAWIHDAHPGSIRVVTSDGEYLSVCEIKVPGGCWYIGVDTVKFRADIDALSKVEAKHINISYVNENDPTETLYAKVHVE